mmetsp:Transcript_25039/g.33572  ORF Transcript_25039/g.33572 Transcript_25039/m.33572 type:complete len:163 (+) Transcript_25039:1494-1982(+)
MPNLNVARHSATGITIGDSLYVFGGVGGATFIERLNLKLNMQRSSQDRFEVIEAKLPLAASDIGLLPCLSPTEILLVGGFSAENKSVSNLAKFSAKTVAGSGSQDHCDHMVEELDAGDLKADFFSTNSVVTADTAEGEAVIICGAQYKHTFNGTKFIKSQAL